MDPVARAREIAARLAATAIPQDVLGKRKSRWEDDEAGNPKKQKKIYIPVDKYPDINFMGLLIGPRGSNQKRMEDESGAKILIRGKGSAKDGEDESDEELHVLITGDSDEAIAKAQSAVEDILFNPQQAMRLKQEQLRKVAELNGTLRNDDFGRSEGGGGGGGHYGPGSGGGSGPAEDSKTTEMQVPRELVGYIIGRGGETIRELQNKSGARIQIVREDETTAHLPHRFVSIAGNEEAVESAQHLVRKLIEERTSGNRAHEGDRGSRFAGVNPDGSDTMEMLVPNERVGLIIGRAGATIKGIQQRTSTSINIPQTPDPNNPSMRCITITGSMSSKEAARAEITAILNDEGPRGGGASGGMIYMQVPNDRVGVVIGKRGETVKAIQDRYGVRIQIPQVSDPGSEGVRTISIQGQPDARLRAKEEIDMVILNGVGGQGGGSYGSGSQYGSYFGAGAAQGGGGYDQYGGQQYGYDQTQGQYDASYYQQYSDGATATASAATSAAPPGTEAVAPAAGGDAAATATTAAAADPNDPNTYWNGFYEYAAYYGIDAANEAWGVTGEAAVQSAESYRQYQEQAAAAAASAVAAGVPGDESTSTPATAGSAEAQPSATPAAAEAAAAPSSASASQTSGSAADTASSSTQETQGPPGV